MDKFLVDVSLDVLVLVVGSLLALMALLFKEFLSWELELDQLSTSNGAS